MKYALVTGAGGFIGSNLVNKLLLEGYYVYGVDIVEHGLVRFEDNLNFKKIIVSNSDFDQLSYSNIEKIDIAFHLGWAGKLGGPDLNDFDMQIGNVVMTERLIKKLLSFKINKFVFCGSISHYKFVRYEIENINSDIYGLCKSFASKLSLNIMQRNKVECNVALLANTFGVGDKSKKAVNTLIEKMKNNDDLVLIEGDTLNDWVYIDDTIDGLIAIALKGKPYKTYYIGNREIKTFKNNMDTMKKATGYKKELVFGGYKDTTVADYTQLDLEALFHDTGFQCKCDLEESLIKTKDYLYSCWEVKK
ncbi:MAG: NAD(P)-dependent oxidoreductase [Erysipelotrichaceae bacterium]